MNVVNVVPMRSAPPPPPPSSPHVSVLLEEAVQALEPLPGGLYVDATLGAGGHTEALLSVPDTRVIGIDRDPLALRIATERLARFGDRFVPLKAAFGDIEAALAGIGVSHVDGLLADIGVSSMQIDDPDRGMSFRAEGPLDMRMDTTSGETALELIDRLDDDELADVLFKLGEERRSRRIARCIKQARESGELETTLDLRRAVVRAVGPNRLGGVDPATRTFQALRIAVNGELDQLSALIDAAGQVVRTGGIAAIISFHSLEDRIVKRAFVDRPIWQPITKKPVVAGEEEVALNPRARSAKLRAARRVEEPSFDVEDSDA
jgi:16S rRNA (cytosine1402-N4)-methyltransferase